ncbi:MAG: M14 family metallopeptidase [Phycisphaerales bacterium]
MLLRAAIAAIPFLFGTVSANDALVTRAERSAYVETSRLADVESFLDALTARSDLVRVRRFGESEEGRPLLLVTLSDPPVAAPREAAALERPIVLIQANIHGGEVEGKEAAQNLMARLALGDLRPILDRVVVLVAPIYNVDGNEAIDVMNRTAQYGPIAGVGRRENAKGLDLNRDYMKLESAEARSFVRLLDAWDPHVVVDLHTTNGSYHGYHLTYSIPVNRSLDATLLSYERDTLMPALAKAMLDGHAFRTYYYGNFDAPTPRPGATNQRSWVAFDHRPRIGQNYVGLRNRIAILSEAYSYLDFKTRVAVTEAFVGEILRYAAEHGDAIRALTRSLDAEFVRRAMGDETMALGVEYEATALPAKVPILVGEVTHETNPRNGKEMTVAVTDRFTPVEMLDFGYFTPKRSVPMARAYVLPRVEAMRPIVEKLRQHGVVVEELTAPLETDVATFTVERMTSEAKPFQGHRESHLSGSWSSAPATLPAGTIVVRLAQPLGRLAAYLLEPESDDGFVDWNFLDAALESGKAAPIRKLMRATPMSTREMSGF